jgi:hypothetical protein
MENQNEKLYGGLVIFAIKDEDKPQVGDTVQIEHLNTPADAEAFGINKGKGIYLVQKDELISQVNGYTLSKAKEFNSLFGKRKANATVVSEQSITLANGKDATMLIIEADKPVVTVKQEDGSEGVIMEFSGQSVEFPDKADFYNVLTTNPDAVENNLTVVKNGTELILMFGDKKIGKSSNEKYLRMFKMFEGQNIPVTYKETSRGLVKVSINEADLTIDTSDMFNDELNRIESIGLSREDAQKAVQLMLYYQIEPNTIKEVLAGWKKFDELGESLIPSISDAIKENKGKTYYSYIDTKEIIHDLTGWTLFNTPVRLVGEMSVGKNLALKTLAAIFRRPMLRLSCNGFTDDTVLLGNTTLKEGVVEFEPGLPILAAQKGYWIVLDEINATPADALIALHSLLENEDGTINIKEIGKVVPAEDFRIFATMNANDDNNLYAGTKDMNAALESRFTTIYMDNELSIKEILKNKCVSASDADINKVVSIYNSLAVLTKDPTKDFPTSFIAVRAYVDILNGPAMISLKKRCIQKLANLNTADPVYREYVEQTVEDIFGK